MIKRERRRAFDRVGKPGVVGPQVDRFRPGFPFMGITGWADDAIDRLPAVDQGTWINRAKFRHFFEHGAGKTRLEVGILFVHIKSGGLPVLVKAKRKVEIRLALQPRNVGADFRRLQGAVVPIEVYAGPVFPDTG